MTGTRPARRIVSVVPDLFFAEKIAATAAAAGVAIEALEPGAAAERCRPVAASADGTVAAREAPAAVILDLGAGPEALAVARALKSEAATRDIPIVGFYSHVDHATREAALAAGVDQVLPRSAFVARLPELLRGA